MGRHQREPVPILEWEWYNAIPISVAVKVWPVSYSTIYRWCNEGKVACWKPGFEWFVSMTSMMRLAGSPQNESLLLEKLPTLK